MIFNQKGKIQSKAVNNKNLFLRQHKKQHKQAHEIICGLPISLPRIQLKVYCYSILDSSILVKLNEIYVYN